MRHILFFVLSGFLFCGVVVAQKYDAPKSFTIVTQDYDIPVFSLVTPVNQSVPQLIKVVPPQSEQLPPKITPRQTRQPTCHFSIKTQRWYFRGSDLAGHVMGTHGRTVRNVFGYTNSQVRKMTRNQLINLHSNAHEWERGVRWNRG